METFLRKIQEIRSNHQIPVLKTKDHSDSSLRLKDFCLPIYWKAHPDSCWGIIHFDKFSFNSTPPNSVFSSPFFNVCGEQEQDGCLKKPDRYIKIIYEVTLGISLLQFLNSQLIELLLGVVVAMLVLCVHLNTIKRYHRMIKEGENFSLIRLVIIIVHWSALYMHMHACMLLTWAKTPR